MNQIKITLFGSFTMTYQNTLYDMGNLLTKQLSGLLELMIYHHQRPLSKDELISHFWNHAEHPQNAMKYAVFRLRSALKKMEGLQALELISTTKQGYIFAPDMNIETDFDQLHMIWNKIQYLEKNDDIFLEEAKKIIGLYQGPIYSNSDDIWLIQAHMHYHTIYEKVFEAVCETLFVHQEFDAVTSCAQTALRIDKFFDSAYFFLMRTYMLKQKYKEAMDIYHQAFHIYQEEYGSMPAVKLKKMFDLLLQGEKTLHVKEFKEKLQENNRQKGAFFCDYDIFRHTYQIYYRNIGRDDKHYFLILLQIDHAETEKKRDMYMHKLKKLIQASLRCGDVFTKLNQSQYAILLSCHTEDNSYTAVQRITSAFYKSISRSKAKLHYFITAMEE